MRIIGGVDSNSIAAAMGSQDSVPFYLGLCDTFSRPLMVLVTPLYLPSEITLHRAPSLQPIFPHMHISTLLLPPLRPFAVYFPSPPVAPVVNRRPPV